MALACALVGCSRAPSLDAKWSAPVAFTNAECHFLAKWNRTLLSRETNTTWLVLRPDGSNWVRIQIPGSEGFSPVAMSPTEESWLLGQWELTPDKDQLNIAFLRLAATPYGLPRRDGTANPVCLKRSTMFGGPPGNTPPYLQLNLSSGCGSGVYSEGVVLVPYQAETDLIRLSSSGKIQTASGNNPAEVGILSSTNSGATWDRQRVFSYESWRIAAAITRANSYLMADDRGRQLWCSTQAIGATNWSTGNLIVKTMAANGYACSTSDDTLHVCWMDDRRKSGVGFFVYGDLVLNNRNNQVYYRHKRDGDPTWSKETLLSGRLSYVSNPTISADGTKVVVAWQNRPGKGVHPDARIYFTTSNDNGKHWTKVQRVTGDNEPSAENPRVALLGNAIHLFYNQSGNLVYRRREFPMR